MFQQLCSLLDKTEFDWIHNFAILLQPNGMLFGPNQLENCKYGIPFNLARNRIAFLYVTMINGPVQIIEPWVHWPLLPLNSLFFHLWFGDHSSIIHIRFQTSIPITEGVRNWETNWRSP